VFIDVIGLCINPGTTDHGTSKTGEKQFVKREVTLMDSDGLAIGCALWGKDAEEFELRGGSVGSVVVIKAAKLSDFNGTCVYQVAIRVS